MPGMAAKSPNMLTSFGEHKAILSAYHECPSRPVPEKKMQIQHVSSTLRHIMARDLLVSVRMSLNPL